MKGLTPLILIGLGLLWVQKRAAAAPAAPPAVDESGMPLAQPGESSQEYLQRAEAWGLQTGQMFPTMMGYGNMGRTGPMWQSMGMVPRR